MEQAESMVTLRIFAQRQIFANLVVNGEFVVVETTSRATLQRHSRWPDKRYLFSKGVIDMVG